jgi:cyclophilin family peptidyl-prolyl cis-trans isomerase/HEAT repeat protein
MTIRSFALTACLVLAGCAESRVPPRAVFGTDTALWRRMFAAEDARGRSADGIVPILEGIASPNPEIRRWAVRALGRLEQDSLANTIAQLLEDSVVAIRAEAANALAQSLIRVPVPTPAPAEASRPREPAPPPPSAQNARAALIGRVLLESDPVVLATLAESIGRLRHADASQARNAAEVILGIARGAAPERDSVQASNAPPDVLLGVVRGLFFLARQPIARGALDATTPLLAELASHGLTLTGELASQESESTLRDTRIRTVAVAALVAANGATQERLAKGLDDPEPYVRREAVAGAAALRDSTAARGLAESALSDSSGAVRFESLRMFGRLAAAGNPEHCARIRSAVNDASDHVALLAIDLLGTRCPRLPAIATQLDSLALILPDSTDSALPRPTWHRAAHALVALAAADPARARQHLARFVAHGNFFVRTYAARAAHSLREEATLRRLADDTHPNVRTAAVEGLRVTAGHTVDAVYISQLQQIDSQLLQAAAGALQGSLDTAAVPALLASLDRITGARSETSRDGRIALLERIGELGDRADADRVRPYLRDFDPAIARRASAIIERWTGSPEAPQPAAPPAIALPTLEEMLDLELARVSIEMADGGIIELRLRPFDAPTNAARFVRLARQGYFDGLTFHRIAPNFVVQGGSPGANEYAGDAPFTRDELGLTNNWRGAVGLSTRGRDTGDAQIYVNLIDNVRLDHDYTVWGEVVSGLDVFDRMLEGAVMRRLTVR